MRRTVSRGGFVSIGSMQAHLGSYRLFERIGRGGMAEVFLGLKLGSFGFARRVVVKCLHDHMCGNPDAENRFVEEAQLASLLEHSNIVQVLDLGMSGGRLFMVMEHVDGLDLKTLLAGYGALPLAAVLHLGCSVSRGLHYAHTLSDGNGAPLGIVHRDVSPSNILISRDGSVKLADFGVAKAAGREKTRAGVVKGKYAYMSPEQVEQCELDARSDLFSLGAVLYEAATGERLFVGNGPLDIMEAVREARVGELLEELGEELAPLGAEIGRALSRQPSDRHADAAAVGRALMEQLQWIGCTDAEEVLGVTVREVLRSSQEAAEARDGDTHASTLEALEREAAEVARSLGDDESETNHYQRVSELDLISESDVVEVNVSQLQPMSALVEPMGDSEVTSRYEAGELRRSAPIVPLPPSED